MGLPITLFLFSIGGCTKPPRQSLRIYCYDSFMAPDGLGEALLTAFKRKCRCDPEILPSGDAGQMVARFLLDQRVQGRGPQVLIGIDQQLWKQVKDYATDWETWRPVGLDQISKDLLVGSGFIPFDFAPQTFIADTEGLKKLNLSAPKALDDLLQPSFKKKFILQDPRTSSAGLGFLMWTHSLKGPDWPDFWQSLRRRWLTMPSGWDEAYALFLKGEAPLVWSYLTSQAYHEEDGDQSRRFQALIFEEGLPLQIEGAMLVRGPWPDEVRDQARELLNLLISKEIQMEVPRRNWMFPARTDVELPSSFRNLPKYKALPPSSVASEELLKRWEQIVLTPQP